MERTSLYQNDLTEERLPTPAQRDDVEHTLTLDPDVDADADEDDDEDDDEGRRSRRLGSRLQQRELRANASAEPARIDIALLRDTFSAWNDDKAPRLAAALSFSTVFSIAPLLIIVIALAGTILGLRGGLQHPHGNIEAQLLEQIRLRAGTQTADTVRDLVAANFSKPHQGIIAQIVGWLTFIIGASGVFASLQDALNTVWHVEPAKQSVWLTVRQRAAALAMVLVIGFLFLVTFILNAAVAFISSHFASELPAGAATLFTFANYAVSLIVITLLFALIFKILPDAKIEWADVWTGAAITALLFVTGQALIGVYLAKSGVASAYGAAGSVLVLLLWIYYSSLILLFGAELTKIYAHRRGRAIVATHGAAAAGDPAPALTPPRGAAP